MAAVVPTMTARTVSLRQLPGGREVLECMVELLS
jgi:hypothetical protein